MEGVEKGRQQQQRRARVEQADIKSPDPRPQVGAFSYRLVMPCHRIVLRLSGNLLGVEAIWSTQQTIRSSSSSETTESEQVYLQGGSHRAFPRSLIKDSGSEEEVEEEEEVRGRGNEGRWRRRRRARTEYIGIWQREREQRQRKMDLGG
ncbi:unnamed protein product [Pleuronectes platessa]|uniref:Uncharacterized protein n=1 Tax=Pleuronectes platessa TaxID=8262 RepID=A0A9N7UTV4_PLEPL|nr:unnamed protein product [Pleuronectes platessa]